MAGRWEDGGWQLGLEAVVWGLRAGRGRRLEGSGVGGLGGERTGERKGWG